MNTNQSKSAETLVQNVIYGIREKKGKNITVLDLTEIEDAICKYMVIAQGNTPVQVGAMEDSVREVVRRETGESVFHSHTGSGEWVALDYIDVIVHLFVPHAREYYRLEQLWADAKRADYPDEE